MPPHSGDENSGIGKYFKKVSEADPMAARSAPSAPQGPVGNDKEYEPPSDSRFDFILNPQKKAGAGLAFISRIPRSILYPLIAVIALFGFIFVTSALNGRKNAWSKQLTDVMARQQEIIRVSNLVQQRSYLENTAINLNATVTATIGSDFAQSQTYLNGQKVKLNKKKLAIYVNRQTDSTLQAAAQSNTADSVYTEYIRQKLTDYTTSLRTTAPLMGPNGKKLLQEYFDSAVVILKHLPPKPTT